MERTFARGQLKTCNCGDTTNCRICAVRKAHEYRMEGDEKKYEEMYGVAVGLVEKERGGTSGPVAGLNRRIR